MEIFADFLTPHQPDALLVGSTSMEYVPRGVDVCTPIMKRSIHNRIMGVLMSCNH
jgi:hypothetical protein